jgi:signal transduction histidine kinase/ActR/RegA family two-component response regulator
MTYQGDPDALLFLASAGISLMLAGFAWRRRTVPTAPAFAVMMLGQTAWALGGGLELLVADRPSKLVFFDLMIVGIVTVPLCFLVFVIRYTGRQHWLTRRRIALACVVQVLTVLIYWTNPLHHVYYTEVPIQKIGGFLVARVHRGPWFWVHASYCYALMAVSIVLLVRSAIWPHGLYRIQVAVLLFGALGPWVVNAIDLAGMSPLPHLDLTAIVFSVTGLAALPGLLRFRILDLIPVARDVVVQGMRDAVIVLDPTGRVVDLNPSAQALLGERGSDSIGLPARTAFADWPELAGRLVQLDETTLEILGPGPDWGARAAYDAKISRLCDGAMHAGWVLVLSDITERKRGEDERARLIRAQAARAEAEAATRAKDQFLAILSHELRTPLTPILGIVTALLDDGAAPAQLRPLLEMVHRNVKLATRLSDDLLDITRISKGKLPLNREAVDAHESIRQAEEVCRADLRENGLVLDLDLAAQAHVVDADPARLQQVFWNLIKNAVKFTPLGGRLAIRTRNAQRPSDGRAAPLLVVEVADSGIGIDPAELPRVFDAFEQGSQATRRPLGGLGLGLTISRSLAEAHGGRLTASSAGKGRGATFTLELATIPAPPPDSPPAHPVAEAAPARQPLKVLLVEDHPDTLNYLRLFFDRSFHATTTAGSLSSALVAAAGDDFDLVVSDIELPDGSGLELMSRLRARRVVPGIALSGYGSEEDVALSRAAGYAEHLTKPVDLHALAAAIRKVAPANCVPGA